MARIADTEIERLKNEISVERLIERSGIDVPSACPPSIFEFPCHKFFLLLTSL